MTNITATNSMFPTGCTELDKLYAIGDPLERLICEDFDSFQTVLLPYSRVWAGHIEPRRKEGGAFLENRWQNFGGRHYTALIRLHHALCAKNRIIKICETEIQNEDHRTLLEVHSLCTSFYDNLGAAIDNFVRAREEALKAFSIEEDKRREKSKCAECGADLEEEKFAARTLSSAESPKLFYAFERRHQFIHSIIVPQKIEAGKILFNLKHFDDVATDWSEDIYVDMEIDSKIQSDWDEILQEFGSRWERLHDVMEQKLRQNNIGVMSRNSQDNHRPPPTEDRKLQKNYTDSTSLSGLRIPSPSGTSSL